MCVCVCVCGHVYMCVFGCVYVIILYMHVCLSVYLSVCACACVWLYMCVIPCMVIYVIVKQTFYIPATLSIVHQWSVRLNIMLLCFKMKSHIQVYKHAHTQDTQTHTHTLTHPNTHTNTRTQTHAHTKTSTVRWWKETLVSDLYLDGSSTRALWQALIFWRKKQSLNHSGRCLSWLL